MIPDTICEWNFLVVFWFIVLLGKSRHFNYLHLFDWNDFLPSGKFIFEFMNQINNYWVILTQTIIINESRLNLQPDQSFLKLYTKKSINLHYFWNFIHSLTYRLYWSLFALFRWYYNDGRGSRHISFGEGRQKIPVSMH